jgi:hypothetical protein
VELCAVACHLQRRQYRKVVIPHELDAFAGDFFDALEDAFRHGLQMLHQLSVPSASRLLD